MSSVGGRSFLLFKPDGLRRDVVAAGRTRARAQGLRLVESTEVVLSAGHVRAIWPMIEPAERPLTWMMLLRYLGGRSVLIDEYAGPGAVEGCGLVKGWLRSHFADFIYANVAHSPDDEAEALFQLDALRSSPGGDLPVLPSRWSGWTSAELEDALGWWWGEVCRRGWSTNDWWCGRRAEAGEAGVAVYVVEEWRLAFDALVVHLAAILGTADPRRALAAALGALYDRRGVFVPVAGPAAAADLRARLAALSLDAVVDDGAPDLLIPGRWRDRYAGSGAPR